MNYLISKVAAVGTVVSDRSSVASLCGRAVSRVRDIGAAAGHLNIAIIVS